MRKFLIKLKTDSVNDLVAMNALYRPGPMEFIPSYIARKNGEEPISYMSPELREILVKKYGEEFTKEHYLKVLELKRKRQLSGGSCEFILSIKPEMMERVMNEIAAIGLNQEEVENIT